MSNSTSNPTPPLSSQPSLISLLSQCEKSGLHNGIFSLRQLVPINQALCRCSSTTSTTDIISQTVDCRPIPNPVTSLEAIIEHLCDDQDRAACERILQDESKDTERLLMIQFLMINLLFVDSIRCVLIPYLLTSSSSSPDDSSSASLSEDLVLALLDLMLVSDEGTTTNNHQEETEEWAIILDTIQTSKSPLATRLMVRLLQSSRSSSPLLIQTFHDKLWQTLEQAVDSLHYQSQTVISSLSKHLLPILTQPASSKSLPGNTTLLLWSELHRPHTLLLWKRLFSLIQNHIETSKDTTEDSKLTKQKQRQVLLVITTVLCPLLPHFLDHDLPFVPILGSSSGDENDDLKESFKKPLEQPALWQVIYLCLEQGKSLLEEGAPVSSILRKRSLYLLDTLTTTATASNSASPTFTNVWKKYVMCVETMEMESEQHLVDQIWDAVAELMDAMEENDSYHHPPYAGLLTWDWMSLLFSRVLSSEQPTIRKLGMYRLLKVHDGKEALGGRGSTKKKNQQQQKRKGKKKTRNVESKATAKTAKPLLDRMTPDFVLEVLLPSWNSLGNSIGYTMHLENNRKVEREDMVPLMKQMLQNYLERISGKGSNADARLFWLGVWSWSLIEKLQIKTILLIFQSLSEKLEVVGNIRIEADNEMLQTLVSMIPSLFQIGSVVLTYRKEILQMLSTMLAYCSPPRAIDVVDGSTLEKWTPMTILHLLSLFSVDHFSLDSEDWTIESEKMLVALKAWVSRFEQEPTVIGAAVATAFVSGQLTTGDDTWDPILGSSKTELELSWAIPLLCTLALNKDKQSTAGELLWPAINKGLSNTAGAILDSKHSKADQVTRAILLLENGCRLRQLSGLGNGDLVVDRNTQQLMPPPPNIEKMLSSSVDFILYHIRELVSVDSAGQAFGGTRQNWTKRTSRTYARLIAQIRMLQQSYPSSNAVSSAVDDILKSSVKTLIDGVANDGEEVMLIALVYAAVSAGANPGADSHISFCRLLLQAELKGDLSDVSRSWVQMARSILHYARWAAISCVLPMLLPSLENASDAKRSEASGLLEDLLCDAFDAVEATPVDALLPLFNCILLAGKHWISTAATETIPEERFYIKNLRKIVNALLAIMKDSSNSQESMYMLNEICGLIFQPKLLCEEYNRLERDPDCFTPVRDAFRGLIIAGARKPHITQSVLCRITVGWLGDGQEETRQLGLNAIPYRDDIVKLLLHKEMKIDESAANQSKDGSLSEGFDIPPATNELSITRAFVLIFLSKLPSPQGGLNEKVLRDLLHYVVLQLLQEVTAPAGSKSKSLIMKGTPLYCLKMRGWQALCILSRFVTIDLAETVCKTVFKSMPELIHSQIRFFVEVFTIKCATMHPEVFGPAFVEQVSRCDLSLQHISSLMILGGNWIVGRYKLPYFEAESSDDFRLRQVLAAVIPWLSSTQGFSRAIAQLLVHALIPLVLNVNEDKTLLADSDWFLRLMYRFLDENREMKRLRDKQSKFFERYDVDDMCTPEGVLSITVDEGDEADPVHLVDVMKDVLQEVYQQTHGSEAPDWKQVEEMLHSQGDAESYGEQQGPDSLVNFQRKIIPLDSLNLAMEDLREKRIRNAAGNRKQQLIVCATLIDKVPNLGGLARTAEIFSASQLVIPDIGVCKMDNFKSLSVGAGDWIDIEEVKEANLLSWLLEQKSKGYFVFGLEQTSSSVSLSNMMFPDRPTVLLLGKEKEGIPVEFLQAVDQCVEIPQLGIIRSLNVHVSGAIAIWEFTKQRRLAASSSS